MSSQVKWCIKCRSEVEQHTKSCPQCYSEAFWNVPPPQQEGLSESLRSNVSGWKMRGLISGEIKESDFDKSPKPPSARNSSTESAEIKSGTVSSEDINRLIRAQNKTTHAVRAFVLFLFYQLTAITIAYAIYTFAQWQGNQSEECEPLLRQYGACEPQPLLVLMALFIWIAGVVYSSRVGWSEIQKSEV